MAGKGRNDFYQLAFVTTGNPDTVNDAATDVPALYPGQIGKTIQRGDRTYQYVKFSASGTAYAANQVLGWKDRSAFEVSNKINTDSKINQVCGIARTVVGQGNYGWMLIKGPAISVKFGGGVAAAAGDTLFAKAASDAGDADRIAAGTAPTYKVLGIATAASGGGNVTADVDLT
jgi:hypothetical protein